MGIHLYKCVGPGCPVETSRPVASETDRQTGQVVHFCSSLCRVRWLDLTRAPAKSTWF